MVVVGGIYSPNHYSSCWLSSLLMDTPESPVRAGHCIVHCPVRATSADRWGLELLAVEVVCPCGAPDSPVAHHIVRCDLTSQIVTDLLTLQTALQSTIGDDDRCLWAH
jgi:hypothetical protein